MIIEGQEPTHYLKQRTQTYHIARPDQNAKSSPCEFPVFFSVNRYTVRTIKAVPYKEHQLQKMLPLQHTFSWNVMPGSDSPRIERPGRRF